MDLLVNIAASNRLNPASFSLSVFNEETGKFRDYKANQRIGTLCVRKEDNSFKPVTVQLNPKKSETRKSSGNLKGATPFEVSLSTDTHCKTHWGKLKEKYVIGGCTRGCYLVISTTQHPTCFSIGLFCVLWKRQSSVQISKSFWVNNLQTVTRCNPPPPLLCPIWLNS